MSIPFLRCLCGSQRRFCACKELCAWHCRNEYEFKVKDIAQYLNMQPGAVSVAIAKGRELAATVGPARNYN